MEYNIKFVNGNRLILLGVTGMILSVTIPIYLRINFNLDEALMIGLIPSILIISWFVAYLVSKQNEYFLITNDGLQTTKHGLVKWNEVHGLDIKDTHEHEVLAIRFKLREKISIPSKINDSPNRQTFVAFREDMERRVLEARNSEDGIMQHSYAYGGKGYRVLGYVLLLALILLTPYVLYVVAIGEMTAAKSISVFVVYASVLPLLGRIFRDEIFGRIS